MNPESQEYRTARALYVDTRIDDLLAFCREQELAGRSELAEFWRGLCWMHMDVKEKAISSFCNCIEINPKNDKAWSNLGVIYDDREEMEKTHEFTKRAFDLNPGSSINLLNWANFLGRRRERHFDAEVLFRQGLRNWPNDQSMLEGLIVSLGC
ncbi:hypothetical protein N8612_05625, partial [Verrucomicrobia bacterium]|nr:hypothetical protein [Verrucomicrobiota bacterium]